MGAYSNSFGGSFASSSGTTPPLRPLPGGPEEKSLAGFLGNLLIKGPANLIGGLGQLIGYAAADVFGAAGQTLSLGTWKPQSQFGGGYNSDDLFKALVGWGDQESVILNDYKRRYASSPGEVANAFYDDPISYVLDFTGLMSLGGNLAGRAGQVARAADFAALTRLGKFDDAAKVAESMSSTGRQVKLLREVAMAREGLEMGVEVGRSMGLSDEAAEAARVSTLEQRVARGIASEDEVIELAQRLEGGATNLDGLALRANEESSGLAQFLDRTARRPRVVADYATGTSPYVRWTQRSPLWRKVFEPVENRFGLETIVQLQERAGRLRMLADEVGDSGALNEANRLDNIIRNMQKRGAYYVESPLLAKGVGRVVPGTLARTADALIGFHKAGFYQRRNEIFKKIRDAIEVSKQEELAALARVVEGVDDSFGTNVLPDEELMTSLLEKGYESPEAAYAQMISGGATDLTANERLTLGQKVYDGEISISQHLEYRAPDDVAELPERIAFEEGMRRALDSAGIPAWRQDLLMRMFDDNARVVGTVGSERYPTIGSYYEKTVVEYLDNYRRAVGERLKEVISSPDFERMAQFFDKAANAKGMRESRRWYKQGRELVYRLFGDNTTIINTPNGPREIRDANLFMQILAVTSPGLLPRTQFGAMKESIKPLAFEIMRRFKSGQIGVGEDNPFDPAKWRWDMDAPEGFRFLDDDIKNPDPLNPEHYKKVFPGKRAGLLIESVRELILGHFIEDWVVEAESPRMAEALKKLADAKTPKQVAEAEEKIRRLEAKIAAQTPKSTKKLAPGSTGESGIASGEFSRADYPPNAAGRGGIPQDRLTAASRLKMKSYYANLVGDESYVTMDRRMWIILGYLEDEKLKGAAADSFVEGVLSGRYEQDLGDPLFDNLMYEESAYQTWLLDNPAPAAKPTDDISKAWSNARENARKPRDVAAQAYAMRGLEGYKIGNAGAAYREATALIQEFTDKLNIWLKGKGRPAGYTPAEVQARLWSVVELYVADRVKSIEKLLDESGGGTVVIDGVTHTTDEAKRYLEIMRKSGEDGQLDPSNYMELFDEIDSETFIAAYKDVFADSMKGVSRAEFFQRLRSRVVGAYTLGDDFADLIRVFRGGDYDTLTHEMGHKILRGIASFSMEDYKILTRLFNASTGVKPFTKATLRNGREVTDMFDQMGREGYGVIRGTYATSKKVDPASGFLVPDPMNIKRVGTDADLANPATREAILDFHEQMTAPTATKGPLATQKRRSAIMLTKDPETGDWFVQRVFVYDNVTGAKRAATEYGASGYYDGLVARTDPSRAYTRIGGADGRYTPTAQGNADLLDVYGRRDRAGVAGDDGGPPGSDVAASNAGLPAEEWSRRADEAFAESVSAYARGKRDELDPRVASILDKYLPSIGKHVEGVFGGEVFGLVNGRHRRVRDILAPSQYPSEAPTVRQTLSEPELWATARSTELKTRARLRDVFGRTVQSRIKDRKRLSQLGKNATDVTDLLGFRVIVDDWRQVDEVIAKMDQAGGRVVGVIDNRAVASRSGQRGFRLLVEFETSPGMITEVEVGTAKWSRVRNATSAAQHAYDADVANYETLARAMADGSGDRDALKTFATRVDKGERYLQGLWESITDEVDWHLTGNAPVGGAMRRTVENLRLMVEEEFVRHLVENLGWSLDRLFDRQYLPMRLKSGAAWNNAIRDFEGGLDSIVLDEQRALKGMPAPVYYPHIDATKVKRTDFLGPKRSTTGMRSSAPATFLERDTGLIASSGDMLADVEAAYQIRAARALKHLDAYDMVKDIVATYGRVVESMDDLSPEEVIFAPDGLIRFFNMKIGFEDEYHRVLTRLKKQGPFLSASILDEMDAGEALGQAVRAALLKDPNALAEVQAAVTALKKIIPEAQREILGVTSQGLELYAIPKVVAERLQKSVGRSSNEMRLFWDKPSEVWRNLVLAGSPRWVMNNIMGNLTFLKMQGGKVFDVVRQILDPEFREYLQELKIRGVDDGFMAYQAGLDRNLGMASETAVGRVYDAVGGSRAVAGPKFLGQQVKRFNALVEDYFRTASYATALDRRLARAGLNRAGNRLFTSKRKLERLATEGIAETFAKDALDEVNYFFNDYSKLSPWEQNVLRRGFAPFYSFYKHMVKLTLTYPIRYPERAAVLRNMAVLAKDMSRTMGERPEWMESAVPFGPDGKWLSVRGASPFAGLTESPTSLLHPFWKIILERSQGEDLFTERPFTDPNVIETYNGDLYRVTVGSDGRPVDVRQIESNSPGIIEHILRQIPQYTMIKQGVAGGRTYDSTSLLDALAGKGVVRDATGAVALPYEDTQLLLKWLGVSTFNYDLPAWQQRQAEIQPSVLEAWYERMGLMS